jgi:DNA-binding IclR family transcriptional regulator
MKTFRMNKSAERVVDILGFVAQREKPCTMAEISAELRIPKSSAFEILYTLVEKEFLAIDNPDLKTFRLGLKLFEVGAAFLSKTNLHREARCFLEKMAACSGETVFLAVEDTGDVVYLDKIEGHASVRTFAVLGSRNSLYRTGLGKALLAAYPESRVRQLVGDGTLETRTPYSIPDYKNLLAELKATRERGYAIDNRENEMDVFCVAAPIFDQGGNPIAAISIASLFSKADQARQRELGTLVTETALAISSRLGFVGTRLY